MSDDKHKKDIDDVTGVETTGHSWDGLKELNNPLPRWWVWVFIVTIIWSVWYFVVYPSWPVPGGATEGTSGYTQYKELEESQDEIVQRQAAYLEKFDGASFEQIMNDGELYAFAMAGGASAFKDNCATCHGTGAAGGKGYPNLNDDDWLWGCELDEIHQSLLYGIRADNWDTRMAQMPAFGKDGLLKREEINNVVDYILHLSGSEDAYEAGSIERGADIFKQQCASCHGTDGKGMHKFGAPNLTDKIWLYGGDRQTIYNTVYYARAGMMPAWGGRLDENTIKQLTVYLHQLGGGEDSAAKSVDVEKPDSDMYEDASLESPEYEKTKNIEIGDEVVAPQSEHEAAQETETLMEDMATTEDGQQTEVTEPTEYE
ncbi:MAG: cytochrome-c oxidase, cbb3-type subunit III [Pseudomonadota bacterium]|nr:cytochrome-c oxidase, cbb3-type subunit III [Pseudomonadota bacterium]